MSEKTATEPERYDGHVPHVVEFLKKQPGDISKLIAWAKEYEQVLAELEEVQHLKESLPKQIDELLQCGKMDDATVEALAKKRAHLDLLPARSEKLDNRHVELVANELGHCTNQIDLAVRRAQELYVEIQVQKALLGYKALGVDEETARKQIALREDFKFLAQPVAALYGGFQDPLGNARALLWCFESFETGFHPKTPEGLKFKAKWVPVEK